ncbi:hypothetical protein PDIDSM_6184 [Penicillium digitatum]|nr:hypothetical protein PDIDSM_6184 [Penicillium digitatum]
MALFVAFCLDILFHTSLLHPALETSIDHFITHHLSSRISNFTIRLTNLTTSDSTAQPPGVARTQTQPGAPNNRDRGELGFETPAERDQPTDPPEPGNFSIACPVAPFKRGGGFDAWLDTIDKFLRLKNIRPLIDATIARFIQNAPNIEK